MEEALSCGYGSSACVWAEIRQRLGKRDEENPIVIKAILVVSIGEI